MALVNCPECGRQNISDTAEQCPACGYSVKNYFEQKKQRDEVAKNQMQFEKKKQQEKNNLQPELEEKLKEIDNLPLPTKSPIQFLVESVLGGLLLLGLAIVLLMLGLYLEGIFLVILGAGFLFFLMLSIICLCTLQQALENYKWKINNFAEWKEKEKDKIKIKYETYATNLAKYGQREAPAAPTTKEFNANSLKCPMCGSTQINKISTLNRTVSIATVGLASSKLGKQYECKSCMHKW